MQLRHIRPRSVEWYDALEWEEEMRGERLTPEEQLRLRTLVAIEQSSDGGRRAAWPRDAAARPA